MSEIIGSRYHSRPHSKEEKKKQKQEWGKGERKRDEDESERRNVKNKRLVSANQFLNKTPTSLMEVMSWICYSLSKASTGIARRRTRSVAAMTLIVWIVTASKM